MEPADPSFIMTKGCLGVPIPEHHARNILFDSDDISSVTPNKHLTSAWVPNEPLEHAHGWFKNARRAQKAGARS